MQAMPIGGATRRSADPVVSGGLVHGTFPSASPASRPGAAAGQTSCGPGQWRPTAAGPVLGPTGRRSWGAGSSAAGALFAAGGLRSARWRPPCERGLGGWVRRWFGAAALWTL